MAIVLRLLYLVGIALAVVLPLRAWIVEPITIASASMEPTLRVGTLLILDKMTLSGRLPRRGEIVSFPSPVGEGDVVKRIVGLPGDVVQLRDKKVYINDAPLDEPYAVYKYADQRLQGDNLGPLEVPTGFYFLLGDNRDESNDSTVWKDKDGSPIRFVNRSSFQGLVRRLPWA